MSTIDLTRVTSPDLPSWLWGAWRRSLLRTGDGSEDRTTDVVWLQTGCLFADIRIPAGRPALPGRRGIEDCTTDELVAAASARGFAGWTQYRDGICRWTRPIDFRPPTGREDTGRMELRDGALWEYGVHTDDAEEYVRAAPGATCIAAWALAPDPAGPRPGVLLIIDDMIMRAVGRRETLPAKTNLAGLVRWHRHEPEKLRVLFDCEISLASMDGLRISRSTLPWREGTRLSPPGAFRVGDKDELIEEGAGPTRRWRRRGIGPDAASLARLLNGA